jgi:hypothetical protein
MKLSGSLFIEAPSLVRNVVLALTTEPELFPDIQLDPRATEKRQERVLALKSFSSLARNLADWSDNLALYEQAGVVRDCMQVVRQVRCEAAMPFPSALSQDRQRAMSGAEKVLGDRQAKKSRSAKRNQMDGGPPEEPPASPHSPPPASPPSPPPPSHPAGPSASPSAHAGAGAGNGGGHARHAPFAPVNHHPASTAAPPPGNPAQKPQNKPTSDPLLRDDLIDLVIRCSTPPSPKDPPPPPRWVPVMPAAAAPAAPPTPGAPRKQGGPAKTVREPMDPPEKDRAQAAPDEQHAPPTGRDHRPPAGPRRRSDRPGGP